MLYFGLLLTCLSLVPLFSFLAGSIYRAAML
uniref:Uncharacterized protein n=1 Tax=Rhizophora mucronata TaxID=61149 RepID=A0A2P2QKP1_RHIMU